MGLKNKMEKLAIYYFDSTKGDMTRNTEDKINKVLEQGFKIKNISQSSVGSNSVWVCLSVVFEFVEKTTEDQDQDIEKIRDDLNVMEEIEKKWGASNYK